MKLLGALLTLFIAVFLVSGCASLDKTSDKVADTNTNSSCTEGGCTMGDEDTADTKELAKEFTIRESNFELDVKEIKVKQGDKVKITVINDEGFHNFAVPDFDVKTKMGSAPKEMMLEFTADKSGEFPYFCEVIGHRNAGMEGKLIVE